MSNSQWQAMRTTLNPFFAMSKQRTIFSIVKDHLAKTIKIIDDHIAKKSSLNMLMLMKKLTCDIICTFLFGSDFGCLDTENHIFHQFFDMVHDISFLSTVFLGSGIENLPNWKFTQLRSKLFEIIHNKMTKSPDDTVVGALYSSGKYHHLLHLIIYCSCLQVLYSLAMTPPPIQYVSLWVNIYQIILL